MPSARRRAYRTVAAFVVAPMMPAVILAGIVLAAGGNSQTLGYAAFAGYIAYPFALVAGIALGFVFLGLFAGLAGFEGEAADPAWLNLLANLAFLLPFVLVCALSSAMVFWWVARPDLQRP